MLTAGNLCGSVAALGPGQMLDLHATTWALNPTSGINEETLQVPQGNELEATSSEGIVARRRPNADGTQRFAVFSSPHFDLDTFADETHRFVNEPSMFLNAIQYSLELHPAAVSLKDSLLLSASSSQSRQRDALCFFAASAGSVDPPKGETAAGQIVRRDSGGEAVGNAPTVLIVQDFAQRRSPLRSPEGVFHSLH